MKLITYTITEDMNGVFMASSEELKDKIIGTIVEFPEISDKIVRVSVFRGLSLVFDLVLENNRDMVSVADNNVFIDGDVIIFVVRDTNDEVYKFIYSILFS